MTKLTFYPLNNADTTFIEFTNGKTMLVDYAHCKAGEDDCQPVVDLKEELSDKLNRLNKTEIDTVLFTHADADHVRNASDFFWFDHAKEYQGDGRIKIKELWVPAAFILEAGLEDCARVIRQEARHRFIKGSGVRVFSRPELLEGWLADYKLTVADRAHLISDAGTVTPGHTLARDGVEFFVHSPFSHRDGDELQSRNDGSVFLQTVIQEGGRQTRVMLGADTPHEVLGEIVRITKFKGRLERLLWDVFKLPHHCSAYVLAAEKGNDVTVPDPDVEELFEAGSEGMIIVSPSKVIPTEDTDMPPHRQAAAYYRRLASKKGGEFIVTMEHPKSSAPAPLEILISANGAEVVRSFKPAGASFASSVAPRAG